MKNGTRILAVRMSSYQYTLLEEAAQKGGITLERMLQLRATTPGSFFRRGYLRWDNEARKGDGAFVLTPDGNTAREQFGAANIERKCAFRPLSSYIKDKMVIKRSEGLRQGYLESYRDEQKHERK